MAYASLFAPRSSPITPVAGRARHTAVHRSGDGRPRGLSPCGWQTGGRGADAGQGHRHPDPQTGQGEPPDPHQRCGQQLRHQLRANRGQAPSLRHRPAHGQVQQGDRLQSEGDAGGGLRVHLQPRYPQPQGVAGNQKERVQTPAPEEPCISWDGGPVTTSLRASGPTAHGCGMPTRDRKPWSRAARSP
jgi:hypothetical protein